MRKAFLSVSALVIVLMVVSCNNDSIYSGFKKTESGAYMKFYNSNESGIKPRLKDEVTLEMAQYFNDSLLFTTAGNEPISIVLTEPDFVGDVSGAVLMMHVGDSARMVVLSDSIFIKMLQMNPPEEYAGKPIYYELKLLSVKPYEILEAEYKALMDSLKQVERDFLVPFREDPGNTLTESGLIIMEKTGRGKVAATGEYVDFDFTMCGPDGDTIMNSFGVESVEMQYGEEFIGPGFTEAIGMVPEGGMMRFVIPSSLAFDSVGYEQFVKPYTPIVVRLKMNSVMSKEAYEKRQAQREAEKEAERNRLKLLESRRIEDYIKTNGITVAPTESGLYILREEEGTGNVAQWGDVVSIHYVLSNLNGDLVESSYDYGDPISFKLGNNEMIPAIEEALMTMAPGAKVTLIAPSELSFDELVIDEELLPAYSPMLIELELVAVE